MSIYSIVLVYYGRYQYELTVLVHLIFVYYEVKVCRNENNERKRAKDFID